MNRLLYTDMCRMYGSKRFWFFVTAMAAVAFMFIVMQYTAMDYQVMLDRVIFLPISFYGLITGALISLFVGDDFSDGVIRNKLVAGRSRCAVFFSNLITCWSACLILYFFMIGITAGIGVFLFENNVTGTEFLRYLGLGMLTCIAFGSLYCMLSMLIGNKPNAVMACMALAFVMLLLSLHTNQILVQPQVKDGALNPHYADGVRRVFYEILHDGNPTGQAAQLSAMECYSPFRFIACDLLWIAVAAVLGTVLFQRKDIR